MISHKWRPVWEDGYDFTQEQLDELAYYLHPGNDVEVHCKHLTVNAEGNPFLLDDWGNWYDLRRMNIDELRIAWDDDTVRVRGIRPSEAFDYAEEALHTLCPNCPNERGWLRLDGTEQDPVCEAMLAIQDDTPGSILTDGKRYACPKRIAEQMESEAADAGA